jgi:hypothetical protein
VIPRGAQALRDLAMKLAISIAPETTSAFAMANTGMVVMLMQCLAQDYDRAAEVRTTDIDEMRTLLEQLRESAPKEMHAAIDEFLRGHAKSLRISDLDAFHAQGLELVIRLHEHVERKADAAADRRIWTYLTQFADRHAFQLMGI